MTSSDTSERKLVWGVLGVSHFALAAAIPAMQKARGVELRALASRSLEKAQRAAREHRVPRAYGSYRELLADPEIEAVYNPLPNHVHVPWSIEALAAGKHVLCEKPIALSTRDMERLAEAARRSGKLLAEGFMIRHHPQWRAALELIRSGRIGDVRAVQTAFSYHNADLENIRNQREAGGGALYDVGCYAVNVARLIFGAEPERVIATSALDPQSGCDRLTSALLEFAGGQASFVIGTQHVPYQRVHVFGTRGHLELEVPFNAPYERSCPLYIDDGFVGGPDFSVRQSSDERAELTSVPAANQYVRQWQEFSDAVLHGAPLENDLESALGNTRVLDALARSVGSERWERP